MAYTPPKPFTDNERKRRWARTREMMEKANLDGLVVSACNGARDSRGQVRYLSNDFVWGRFGVLVFPLEGDPIGIRVGGWIKDNRSVHTIGLESSEYTSYTVKAVNDLELADKRVGLVGHNYMFPSSIYEALLKECPKATFVGADRVVDEAKWVKSAEEIDAIKHTVDVGAKAYDAFREAAKPGKTPRQLMGTMIGTLTEYGSEVVSFILNCRIVGERGFDRKLKKGDSIVFFPEYAGPSGYWTHWGRTVCLGTKPPKELQDAYDKHIKYTYIGVDMLKPGTRMVDVYDTIKDAILKDGYQRVGVNLGHGMGLDCSEVPYCTPGTDAVIEENMTISLHPSPGDRTFPSVNNANLYLATKAGGKSFHPPDEFEVV